MKRLLPCALLSLSLFATAATVSPVSAAAQSIDSDGAGTSLRVEIDRMEKKFFKDVTVAQTLNESIETYTLLEENSENELKRKYAELVESTKALLKSYKKIFPIDALEDVLTREDFLAAAVAVIIAVFHILDFELSAELLTRMRSNSELDSIYSPAYSSRVLDSRVVANMKDCGLGAGTGYFPNTGSAVERDAYFSLHNFKYAVTACGDVVIVDRYDYAAGGFGFIQDVPIKLAYEAQEAGLLTPYYVVIEGRANEEIEPRAEFSSPYVSYCDGEYHVYDGGSDCECNIGDCNATRRECARVDTSGEGVCEICGSILPVERNFWSDAVAVSPVTSFFQKIRSKIRSLWARVKREIKRLIYIA